MTKFSAIAVFCEDIREEKGGINTLIGILPDNLRVPSTPGLIPKLCIYIRVNLDPSFAPGPIGARLIYPNGEELKLITFDSELIEKARSESRKNDNPVVGVISRTVLGQFEVPTTGRLKVVLSVDGEDYVCGALNIQLREPALPSASEPQPSQSPAASPEKDS